jgi:hypothetical protein
VKKYSGVYWEERFIDSDKIPEIIRLKGGRYILAYGFSQWSHGPIDLDLWQVSMSCSSTL